MTKTAAFFSMLFILGCAASPREVFERSTSAFARGDVEAGVSCFSRDLLAERPVDHLTIYYAEPDHRETVAFLLKNHTFTLLEETEHRAVAQVIWTTGDTEKVYFVRENGRWKIDRAPRETKPAGGEG